VTNSRDDEGHIKLARNSHYLFPIDCFVVDEIERGHATERLDLNTMKNWQWMLANKKKRLEYGRVKNIQSTVVPMSRTMGKKH